MVQKQSMANNNCIFCGIVEGNVKSFKVGENEHAFAFLDAFPVADGHTLVIPKKHAVNYSSTDDESLKAVSLLAKEMALKLQQRLQPAGLNYVVNEGAKAGQEVFHYHMHVVPKYETGLGFCYNVRKTNNRSIEANWELLTKEVG